MLADMLVSSLFSPDDISDWALLRSLIGISAVLPLIGLDQVLVRRPAASAQVLRLLSFQVPVLSCVVGVILFITEILPNWWIGSLLAIGSAASLAQFQYFRSHHKRVLSQLAQQGWKIAAFVMVGLMVVTGWRGDLILSGVLLVLTTNIVMAGAMLRLPPSQLHPQTTENVGKHYAIGSRFMVTTLLLAMSVYAEQVVVNRLGNSTDAALYFTSATYFLFPISFLNGYLAFLIGPWLRDNHDRFAGFLHTRWLVIVGFPAAAAALLNLLGWWLWQVVTPPVGQVDPVLQGLFFLMAFVRTLYALPSGYLGVFGMPHQHDILILLQIVALVPVVALFLGLRWVGFDLVHSVAAASALNWCCRTLVGYGMTAKIIWLRSGEPRV
ncbi:hypothetical protein OS190_09035 [Sulfitobacter sp. F26204]|uniref:hypothetical protein n=1 Tax=Sulfitobacter sp. F26204 TaxID=2996014 RepID=UPI00225E5963|nr:hypothetical protein [Sulfitobacter sp. F26204]MCX7559709.1 hypothetical protein [Sulfitobacter sp. F26204]